ncbi:MAG: hypothetical protein IJ467_05060 [Bacteroidaceae bacterium]|nr:hypothetical protein [Bacteroidaceae bacterium]
MKNKISYTFVLTVLVIGILWLLSYLPVIEFGETALRRVDLLSDIRQDEFEQSEVVEDSLPNLPLVKPEFVDSCKSGLTCIEDFSDSLQRGMLPFYAALSQIDSLDRPVRIAYLGDSFIEGDIFTAHLRSLLQERWGGKGVGWVDITSQVYGFRPTVTHSFHGWESHISTDSVGFDRTLQGLSGRYFIPAGQAYVDLRGKKYLPHLDTCDVSTFYFKAKSPVELTSQVNGSSHQRFYADTIGRLQQCRVEGRIGRVRWQVSQPDAMIAYGVAMEGTSGITVDNFSLRGSSGLSLAGVPMSHLRQFSSVRPYDLLVLQFGLNVANKRQRNYESYYTGMLHVVKQLKHAFPDAGILVVGVGDRSVKDEFGELHTMDGIKHLIRYQRQIAADGAVAFWNLYEAMGGDGSMPQMVKANPPMANLDYTHINFRGGEHLAHFLYETICYGYEQYEKRKAYEAAW